MKKAMVILFPLLLGVMFVSVEAQPRVPFARPFATPTPSPTPRPTPPPPPPVTGPAACPQVTIGAGTARTIRDGQPLSFNANIAGGDPRVSPIINWNVSAGMIREGQGTRKIDVDSTGSGSSSDRQITADLWVGGYAAECPQIQVSTSVKIIPPAAKFGEFGELDAEALKTNLKALAQFLSQSEDNLYLIGYAGRNNERGYASNSIRKMKDQLSVEGIAPRRIIAMDGGFREEPLFDFWVVPMGAEPPRPMPTVNRNEIVYPKPTPKPPAKKP